MFLESHEKTCIRIVINIKMTSNYSNHIACRKNTISEVGPGSGLEQRLSEKLRELGDPLVLPLYEALRSFRGRGKGGEAKKKKKKKSDPELFFFSLPPPPPLMAPRTSPRSSGGQSRVPELSQPPGESCFRVLASPDTQNNHGIIHMYLTKNLPIFFEDLSRSCL